MWRSLKRKKNPEWSLEQDEKSRIVCLIEGAETQRIHDAVG